MKWAGSKKIWFGLSLLLFCCVSGYSEYILQDSEFLRLRVLLASSLGISIESIDIVSQQGSLLTDSSEITKKLSDTINNLTSDLKDSKETAARLLNSLNQRLIVDIVIVLAAFGIGYGLGKL